MNNTANLEDIKSIYQEKIADSQLLPALKDNKNTKLKAHFHGLHGSSGAFVLGGIFSEIQKKSIIVLSNKEEAAYFYNDIGNIVGEQQVYFLPSSFKYSFSKSTGIKYDSGNLILRTEVLNNLTTDTPLIVVSYPDAIQEMVLPPAHLQDNTIQFKVGEEVSMDFVAEILDTYNFSKVDFVYEPGQYSIRGSIMDIFSYANEDPYRIDFFGEEVESIRTFDTVNQLSKEKFGNISIIPNVQEATYSEEKVNIFEYLGSEAILAFKDVHFFYNKIDDNYNKYILSQESEEDENKIPHLLAESTLLKNYISDLNVIEFSPNSFFSPDYKISFDTQPQPDYQKNFNLLTQNLLNLQDQGYRIYILSENKKQLERLESIFESETNDKLHFTPVLNIVHEGFMDQETHICVYTDHEIFQRYHRYKLRSNKQSKSKEALTLKELNSLEVGDYVVHADHGIAKFGGLQKMEVNGKTQETVRLIFKDNDALFVNIHSLHKISKYRGKDGTPPKIYKLGSGAWQKLKKRTKKKVKDIARELINLYAKRKARKGFAFSPDSYLQEELESSFFYEDTPDQLKATNDVKKDMESPIPMDRLVCGDVGFGKTEVAIRAAFKAVNESKQVAVLAPTTILTYQHYNTFRERLKEMPVEVDYISRLKTTAKQKQSIKDLQEGKTDIIIGTHRLVGKDIQFKDLGLLIIDEEQKFGVSIKEKLKNLRVSVDTLTLTATPIPRTLQFSLMGARDLSIINTPPPNRYPIVTELHQFNEKTIKEAIEYEISRNGQIYFIHNRIQNIYEVEKYVNRVVPNASTIVAHGQMEGPKLESIMLGFINQEYDVLVATSIIESGLDIPNVNTIIINNAQNYGLSDLHQLRGRVGRTNKKAFAYLLSPPLTAVTKEAQKRLKSIEEYSELGSGFTIAMRDLDIRGAGNLLGGEQSGFINDIGFETYNKILDEALHELRETEYQDILPEEEQTEDKKFVTDCQIDTDLELLFPEDYIENVSERIRLYKKLDSIENEEELQKFEEQLTDRFGKPPQTVKELLDVVRLRQKAITLGIEKIILKSEKMLCYFVSDQESQFYQSYAWQGIIRYIQKNPVGAKMKEDEEKLRLVISPVKNIEKANTILNSMMNERQTVNA